MRYFGTLLRLQIWSRLRSASFAVTAACFLVLALGFAVLLPDRQPSGLTVGLFAESQSGRDTAEILQKNASCRFLLFDSVEALERDLLAGKLHCGYRISDGENPVTALTTDGSYMRPLLDEVVLSAYAEARLPQDVRDYLMQAGLGSADVEGILAGLRGEATPMTITVQTVGKASVQALAEQSVSLLLYAVLTTAFLGCAVLSGLLAGDERKRALQQLSALSGRRLSGALAPALADVLLNLAVLVLTDVCISRLLPGGYQPAGRAALLLALALLGVAFRMLAAALRRFSGAVAALMPVWLLAGIFCSGSIISPELLPAGLGILRFFSPAWYLLRLLQGF